MKCSRILVAAVLVVGGSSSAAAQAHATSRAPLPSDSLAIARKYTLWFLTSRADSLFAHMDSASQAQGIGTLQQNIDGFIARAGDETERMEERWILRRGVTQYWYQAKFSQAPEPVVIRWVLDSNGKLSGMGLSLLGGAPPADPKP